METREQLLEELKEIEKWEKDQKGLWFWEKLTRLPFKFLDRITPAFIQEKMGNLLDELGSFVQTGGQYLSNEKAIFTVVGKKMGKEISSLGEVGELPVQTMKEASLELTGKRKKAATIQGASTGIGGIFTLAIDIPAILGISLKTLQEIALIHGYDPHDKKERVFILKCLQFSSADVVGKQAILDELLAFNQDDRASKELISQIQGWREVALTYTDRFGWKKLLQMVPVAGILFGAFANRSMVSDLAETGTMLYQKRKIFERLQQEEKASLLD